MSCRPIVVLSYVVLLSTAYAFMACSKRLTPTVEPTALKINAQVQYRSTQGGQVTQNITGEAFLQVVQNRAMWLSVRKWGIEGFRVLITVDTLRWINRLDKTYGEYLLADLARSQKVSGRAILPLIQAIFLGTVPLFSYDSQETEDGQTILLKTISLPSPLRIGGMVRTLAGEVTLQTILLDELRVQQHTVTLADYAVDIRYTYDESGKLTTCTIQTQQQNSDQAAYYIRLQYTNITALPTVELPSLKIPKSYERR